jgi:hypothetical protein
MNVHALANVPITPLPTCGPQSIRRHARLSERLVEGYYCHKGQRNSVINRYHKAGSSLGGPQDTSEILNSSQAVTLANARFKLVLVFFQCALSRRPTWAVKIRANEFRTRRTTFDWNEGKEGLELSTPTARMNSLTHIYQQLSNKSDNDRIVLLATSDRQATKQGIQSLYTRR